MYLGNHALQQAGERFLEEVFKTPLPQIQSVISYMWYVIRTAKKRTKWWKPQIREKAVKSPWKPREKAVKSPWEHVNPKSRIFDHPENQKTSN